MEKLKIKHVLFEISDSCNFRCRYCYFHERKYMKAVNLEKAKKIIRALKRNFDIQTIGFTGGEPLIRKDIFKILAYCKKLDLKTSIGTNGSLINRSNISSIKKYVDTITISIDGDGEYFNWITNSSSYSKVSAGLELLKNIDMPFGVHITVTPYNLKSLALLINKFKILGAKFVQVGDVQVTQGMAGEEFKNLILSSDQLANLYEIISAYQNKEDNFIKHAFVSKNDLGAEVLWEKKLRKFFHPFFVISADGKLYPMVDVDNKWVLSDDVANEKIDIQKLNTYISKVPEMIATAKRMLKNQEVISPYSIIRDVLKK